MIALIQLTPPRLQLLNTYRNVLALVLMQVVFEHLGSHIRNGEAYHTGCIPFYKHFQTAVKSCSQGGVRGGAAPLFYPLWHLEVENLLST